MTRGKYERKGNRIQQSKKDVQKTRVKKAEIRMADQQENPRRDRIQSVVNRKNPSNWVTARVRDSALFIFGTLFGLYFVHWFVAILPGPNINAGFQGIHVGTGNAAGCTFYTFTVTADDPIEFAYAKMQFPTRIVSFKVGFPMEAETKDAGRMQMQVFEGGRDAQGQCTVVQSAINNDADVQSSASGNMIAFHASKLPAKAMIIGMVALSDHESSVTHAPKTYTEGAYEYIALGQTVRKPLTISDGGISDAK